jgi:hypothetical protein
MGGGVVMLPRLELADAPSPFDEAVLLIGGREEETITIECDGSRELAERIAAIVNHHAQLVRALTVASEVLRRFGAQHAAAEIEELSRTIGDAA